MAAGTLLTSEGINLRLARSCQDNYLARVCCNAMAKRHQLEQAVLGITVRMQFDSHGLRSGPCFLLWIRQLGSGRQSRLAVL